MEQSAFTIQQIINLTDSAVTIAVTSLGNPTDPINEELFLLPNQPVTCSLSFGRQEKMDYMPSTGFLLVNKERNSSFSNIRCLFEGVEDPLADIPIKLGYRYKPFSHMYYWSLFCDTKRIASFSSPEYRRVSYALYIKNDCLIEARALV